MREETRCRHMGYSFLINSKVYFVCTIPQTAHTMAFVIPVVEHWLEREIAQWVSPPSHLKDRSGDPSHHERTLLPQRHVLLEGLTKARPVLTEAMSRETRALKLSWDALGRCSNVPVRMLSKLGSIMTSLSVTRSFSHQGTIPATPHAGPGSWKKSLCSSSARKKKKGNCVHHS